MPGFDGETLLTREAFGEFLSRFTVGATARAAVELGAAFGGSSEN